VKTAVNQPPFSATVTTAIRIARDAGDVLLRWYSRDRATDDVHYKGPADLQTAADRASESLIVAAIEAAFPRDGAVAEEGGGTRVDGQPVWYVDPLDGTTNFAHRNPFFAVSLGYGRGGELHAGVIYQPMSGEMFAAEQGAGAWLRVGTAWTRLAVSSIDRIDHALVATGTPADIRTTGRNVDEILAMLKTTRDVRIYGSAALNLAYVAAGRLEAFWEPGLNVWDVAAGVVLVREAAGLVTSVSGEPFKIGDDVFATNGLVHEALRNIVAGARVRS
jgi:myo-inositol-1(or 4)-monophosphatase